MNFQAEVASDQRRYFHRPWSWAERKCWVVGGECWVENSWAVVAVRCGGCWERKLMVIGEHDQHYQHHRTVVAVEMMNKMINKKLSFTYLSFS